MWKELLAIYPLRLGIPFQFFPSNFDNIQENMNTWAAKHYVVDWNPQLITSKEKLILKLSHSGDEKTSKSFRRPGRSCLLPHPRLSCRQDQIRLLVHYFEAFFKHDLSRGKTTDFDSSVLFSSIVESIPLAFRKLVNRRCWQMEYQGIVPPFLNNKISRSYMLYQTGHAFND